MAAGHPYNNCFLLRLLLKGTGLCDHAHVAAKRIEHRTDSSIRQTQNAEIRTSQAVYLDPDLAKGIDEKVCLRDEVPVDGTFG